MNIKVLLLSLVVIMSGCMTKRPFVKIQAIPITSFKMDTADINRLNRAERSQFVNSVDYVNENGQFVQLEIWDAATEFSKSISEKGSSVKTILTYDKKSLALTSQTLMFSDLVTGITKKYDIYGNVVEEVDNDILYPFNVDKLVKLIYKQFRVNLGVSRPMQRVIRYKDEESGMPVYNVTIPIKEQIFRSVIVRGDNGVIINNGIGSTVE